MEGIVSKRCLRGSDFSVESQKEQINKLYNKGRRNVKTLGAIEKNKTIKEIVLKTKIKLWIQLINVLIILSLIIVFNILDISNVNNNKIVKGVKAEYRKNYSKQVVIDNVKKINNKIFSFVSPIVPDKIENKIKNLYIELLKKDDRKTNQNINVEIYKEPIKSQTIAEKQSKEINKKAEDKNKQQEYIESVSAISTIDLNVQEIKAKNISFTKPTSGTVTSLFGAREKIFEELEEYHTGIDIANAEGTNIVSAMEGKVIKADENEYAGKFVEVENKEVTTRYLHMSKIKVKQGQNVKLGESIGLMGSTGKSTGPHLHFEIVFNKEKVDPAKLIAF